MEMNKYTKVVGNGCKELRCKLEDVISAPKYGVLSWTDDSINIPEDLYPTELITDAESKKIIADKLKRDYELCGLDAEDAEEVTDTGIVAYIEGYVVHLVFELPDGKRFVFNNLGDETLFNHKVDIDTIEVMEIGELIYRYCNLKTFNNYECILEISCDKYGIENRCSDEHAEAMAYAIMQYEKSHGNNISRIEAYEKVADRLGDYKFDDYYSAFGIKRHNKVDLNLQEFTEKDLEFTINNYKLDKNKLTEIQTNLLSQFPYDLNTCTLKECQDFAEQTVKENKYSFDFKKQLVRELFKKHKKTNIFQYWFYRLTGKI